PPCFAEPRRDERRQCRRDGRRGASRRRARPGRSLWRSSLHRFAEPCHGRDLVYAGAPEPVDPFEGEGMTTDFATDLDCSDDLNPLGTTVSGPLCLAQAIQRRLSTPRGMVIDAPNYGRDLREYLSRGMTAAELEAIPGDVRAEVLKDERIEEVDAGVT